MTGDRPRTIFVSPVLPASHGNGLAMRAGLFLEGMSRRHRVTVVVVPVFGPPPAERDFVSALAEACVTLELSERADGRAWSIPLGTPAGRERARQLYPLPTVCSLPSVTGHDQLRALTTGASLVHVMRSYLLPCADFVLDDETRPAITLDLDELDSDVQRQLGDAQDADRFERLERYYLPRVDHVYTASGDDARVVAERYGVEHVSAVTNAVRAPFAIEQLEQQYDLLFVGNLSYEPNVDAARWLCEQVRPLLGSVTIAIVGSDPRPEVLALAELAGVTVAGDVPEVTSWYARSRIAVAPLRLGGGTRTKIAEALAHGRPVVSTAIGAAGIAVGIDNGVLVAGTAGEFAATCRRLLDEPSTAVRIGAAGRRRVTTAEQVVERVDLLTRSVVEQSRLPTAVSGQPGPR